MEPNLGQGAAQTIEDADALRAALRATADLPDALAQYETGRRARAQMFQRESTRFARVALSRYEAPRNLVARLIPGPVRDRSIEYVMNRHAPSRPGLR
jgi:2-polyprenyl-6-methoxyphenol hydroxylase-like FAD-dependent oxidoreductase